MSAAGYGRYGELVAAHDGSGMLRAYDAWPELAAEAYGEGTGPMDLRNVNHMVFAGMGGSGTLGDFFGALLSGTDMHVSTVKGYNLPKTVDRETLVVCTSVSGNTAETLSVLGKAAGTPCRRVVFASGGRLAEYCASKNIPYYNAKAVHSPRASFAPFLYTMLGALGPGIVPRSEVYRSIGALRRAKKSINSENLTAGNPALGLADWIRGIPVIYYPWGFKAAAIRFKNSLQENAKNHAMAEDVLEASHNGVVAWERAAPVCPILLQGPDDDKKTRERWGVFREYFGENSIPYRTVRAEGGHIISKLAGLVYTLDCASIYLAVREGVDPTPVRPIDFVRERTASGV